LSKQTKIITVFTPTYNRAHTLHRVYESLQTQTLQKIGEEYVFEWLIVDDGSTDDTKKLIDNWINEVDFDINYVYQENKGKIHAMRNGIELCSTILFLSADSDDAFLPETIETFYTTWNNFNDDEKEKCGGIGVLCKDQNGNRVGEDYPIANKLIPTIDIFLAWRNKNLGETWAILKTENLKKCFKIPDEAKKLKFIPESFFWSRITYELKPYSYFINKILRVYYVEQTDSISSNIRNKYPDGFLFESKWFVLNYWWVLFKYPKVYLKHLIKYIYYGLKVENGTK
jgi:glycosyltransferase involved in cell wall biosynthesis